MVRNGSARISVLVDTLDCERDVAELLEGSRGLRARLYGVPKDLARGDRVEAIAQLGVVRLFRNLGQQNPYVFWSRSFVTLSGSALVTERLERSGGFRAGVDRARAYVRRRLDAKFSTHATGMAKALVLGENDLSQQEHEAFNQSGLAHLLAVSGTHLVFAVVVLVRALRSLLARCGSLPTRFDVGRISALAGVVLALVYADFAGGSGSAWRAAWMLAAAFFVRALGARVTAPRAVATSVVVGFVYSPLMVFDLSFLLSLAATAGLLTIGKAGRSLTLVIDAKPLRLIAESLLATVSSVIPCALVLALFSEEISVLGIFANVVAGPFGEMVALPLCLVFGLLGFVPVLEQGVATVASGALLIVRELALRTAAQDAWSLPLLAPGHFHYSVVALVVAACIAAWALASGTARRRALLLALGMGAFGLVASELVVRHAGVPKLLRVTHLDVGQGDAALVDLPGGELMLIDGGGFVGSPVDPGVRVILPVLRTRRRRKIDVMVLSHPHPDHYGGLVSVAEALPVGELWDTGQGRSYAPGSKYAQLVRAVRKSGGIVRGPGELCGRKRLSGASVDVLGPCPDFDPDQGANDNSLVLRLSAGGGSVLFTGDAEAHQEERLINQRRSLLRATHLKVAHHGSKTSTSRTFLQAVAPDTAVVSSGMRNRFGHPHPATLQTLKSGSVDSVRLDEHGSVVWTAGAGLTSTWLLETRHAGIFNW